jgi:RHS repeat-associated protein
MKDETRVISGVTYKTCNTYDAFGRVRTQKYPTTSNCTGETLNYSYNATGNLESVTGTATYVSNMDYDEFGQVAATYLNTGNIVSQPCYAANNRRIVALRAYTGALQSCTVANPTNSKLNLKYTYFNNGNVQQIVDQTRSETLNYTYDDLDRLWSVSGAYSQSFSYNAIGNFIAKAGVTHTYNANSPATGCVAGTASTKPHAAQQAGTDTYVYDCNGSMTSRVESGTTYTQNFNAENMMTSVVTGGQTTTFVYDGDNTLVKKINPNGTYTVYIGGLYEVEYGAGGAATKKTSYYPGGAMRVDIVGGSNTLYYMLKDHLGSASTLLDTNGNVVANGEQRYYPFGEKRITSADLKTAHLFTGQLEVGLGGIYSYGARMYSPRLGRFLSADTIVPSWTDPQSLNRFSYVGNNPLRYIDPTGHTYLCDEECEDDGWTPSSSTPAPPNNDPLDPGLPMGGGGGSPYVPPPTQVGNGGNQPVPDAGVDNTPSIIVDAVSAGVVAAEVAPFSFNTKTPIFITNTIGGKLNNYTLPIRWTAGDMSKVMSSLGKVLTVVGLVAAVAPRQIADAKAGAPWNVHVADALIDAGIWAAAVGTGVAIGALMGGTPLGVAAGFMGGLIVSQALYGIVDQTNFRARFAENIGASMTTYGNAMYQTHPYGYSYP